MDGTKTNFNELTQVELKTAIRIIIGDFADESAGTENGRLLSEAKNVLPKYKFAEYKRQLEKGVKRAFKQMSKQERDFLLFYIQYGELKRVAKEMDMDLQAAKELMSKIVEDVKALCTFDYSGFFGRTEIMVCLSKLITPEKWKDLMRDSAWNSCKDSISARTDEAADYVYAEILTDLQRSRLNKLIKKDGIPKGESLSWIIPTLVLYEEFLIYGKEEALRRKKKRRREWEVSNGLQDKDVMDLQFLTLRQCCTLINAGFRTVFDLCQLGVDRLREIDGIGVALATKISNYLRAEGYVKE